MRYLVFLFDCSLQLSLAPESIARVAARHRLEWLQRIDHQISLAVMAWTTAGAHKYNELHTRITAYKKLRTLVNFSSIGE